MLDDAGPAGHVADRRVADERIPLLGRKPGERRPSRPTSRSKSASVAGRNAGTGQTRSAGGLLEPIAGGAHARMPMPGATNAKAADAEQQHRCERDEHQADVDDVGQPGARHADQEDHVAHDVVRGEDPPAHLARGVPLEQHRPRDRGRAS